MRAARQFVKTCLATHFDVKSPSEEAITRCLDVFAKRDGSWVKVFEGSVEHITLLKTILKVAVAKKLFQAGG